VIAEKTDLFLPDSSKVTLNAFSEASFQAYTWKRKRQVKLAGEAFFKVKKGSKFDVVTEAGTVTVLGTQFNVKVRKDYFEVICYEGMVEVRSAGKVIKLPPTKVFRTVKGLITPNDHTTEIAPAWLRNESSFESVPFNEVIEEFERQYHTTISTKNINGDQLFTGRFIHSDISLALKSISIPLNLKYEVSGDGKNVVLSGEVK
jgi:ferric-dicitrate binding protein FerR (iron transport regulator)